MIHILRYVAAKNKPIYWIIWKYSIKLLELNISIIFHIVDKTSDNDVCRSQKYMYSFRKISIGNIGSGNTKWIICKVVQAYLLNLNVYKYILNKIVSKS